MAMPFDIVGYTFNADVYCSECILEAVQNAVNNRGFWWPSGPTDSATTTELVLDWMASEEGINREDEATFDSGDFPKVVFRDSATDYVDSEGNPEQCGKCGNALVD